MSETLNLEALGFDRDEIRDRVIEQIADRVIRGSDESFDKTLDNRIHECATETINRLADEKVLPNVSKYIEDLVLQSTNEWGEKKGKPVSFVEYLVQRAEAYMQEKVSFEGKGKGEGNSYGWSGTQTRITYLINKHLHYSIATAVKDALSGINESLGRDLAETVKIKLREVTDSLKVEIKTR